MFKFMVRGYKIIKMQHQMQLTEMSWLIDKTTGRALPRMRFPTYQQFHYPFEGPGCIEHWDAW